MNQNSILDCVHCGLRTTPTNETYCFRCLRSYHASLGNSGRILSFILLRISLYMSWLLARYTWGRSNAFGHKRSKTSEREAEFINNNCDGSTATFDPNQSIFDHPQNTQELNYTDSQPITQPTRITVNKRTQTEVNHADSDEKKTWLIRLFSWFPGFFFLTWFPGPVLGKLGFIYSCSLDPMACKPFMRWQKRDVWTWRKWKSLAA